MQENNNGVAPAKIVQVADAPETKKEPENVLLGTLGAVIGSIAGGLLIIILSRVGFVAAISGFVMAFATIGLYQKFAKGLSTKGIIICIVVMVLMTLLAENIADSIQVMNEANAELKVYGQQVDFGYIFFNFYDLIAQGAIKGDVYAGSLGLTYLFTALGAFSIIKSSFSNRNKK